MYNTINDKNQNRRGSLTYYSNGLKQLWTSNQQIKEEVDDIHEIPVGLSVNDAWKIVGSPPRRMSLSGPTQQVQESNSNPSNLLNVDEYTIESTRRRNRAASTPLPPINNEIFPFAPFSNLKTSEEASESDEYRLPNHSKQWSDVSWSTNSKSIWNNDNMGMAKPSVTLTNMDNSNNYLFLNNNGSNGNNGGTAGGMAGVNTNINGNIGFLNGNKPLKINTKKANININTNTKNDKNNETNDKDGNDGNGGNNESIGRQYRSSSFSLGTFGIHQPINEVDEIESINTRNDLHYLKPNNANTPTTTTTPTNNYGGSVGGGGIYNANEGNNSYLSFPYEMPKVRSRSKSSSEIDGKFSNHSLNSSFNDLGMISQGYPNGINDMNNNMLWGNNNINNVNLLSALLSSRNNSSVTSPLNGLSTLSQLLANDSSVHRRSSTQPMYSNIWGTQNNTVESTHSNVNNTSLIMPTSPTIISSTLSTTLNNNNNILLSPQMNYFNSLNSASINTNSPNTNTTATTTTAAAMTTAPATTANNMSTSTSTAAASNKNNLPSIITTSNTQNIGLGFQKRSYSNAPPMSEDIITKDNERRHSLQDSSLYSGLLNGVANVEKSSVDDTKSKALSTHDSDYVNEIDDYFENTEHRTRAWVEAGKNLQSQQSSQHWPIYIIEFKAGRTDYFYISENSGLIVKVNDLVIVEADRGKDLGKVVASNITSFQQIQMFHSQHSEEGMELQKDMQIHPKRIYRMAQSAEIDMLISKCQDEVKAKNLCQGKVRQRKLPMEIVDAEFQWDRKKLTFYFVSDRRIDFRELVRELFKIYKTRIWMCAVSSIPN